MRQEIESERAVISKAQRYGTWQRLLELLKSLQFNWAGTMTAKFRYRLHHIKNMKLTSHLFYILLYMHIVEVLLKSI